MKFDQMVKKNTATETINNITNKNQCDINMPPRQLAHIESNHLMKGLNFSITSKSLPNKHIIATIEDPVRDFEREETDTVCAKISLALQNSKPPKDNISKDEHQVLKKLQSDTAIITLSADKDISAVILNSEDYL